MGSQLKVGSHKTNIRTEGGFTRVRYHDTDVVSFNENGIVLDNGGWFTSTTKTRMNQASNQFGLDYIVFQKDFKWYVEYQNVNHVFHDGRAILIRKK